MDENGNEYKYVIAVTVESDSTPLALILGLVGGGLIILGIIIAIIVLKKKDEVIEVPEARGESIFSDKN